MYLTEQTESPDMTGQASIEVAEWRSISGLAIGETAYRYGDVYFPEGEYVCVNVGDTIRPSL